MDNILNYPITTQSRYLFLYVLQILVFARLHLYLLLRPSKSKTITHILPSNRLRKHAGVVSLIISVLNFFIFALINFYFMQFYIRWPCLRNELFRLITVNLGPLRITLPEKGKKIKSATLLELLTKSCS